MPFDCQNALVVLSTGIVDIVKILVSATWWYLWIFKSTFSENFGCTNTSCPFVR